MAPATPRPTLPLVTAARTGIASRGRGYRHGRQPTLRFGVRKHRAQVLTSETPPEGHAATSAMSAVAGARPMPRKAANAGFRMSA